MPTIFTHAVFASAAGEALKPENVTARYWLLTIFCSMLPDADAVGFFFGVSYGSMLGHRGITHSICFALLVGLIGSQMFRVSRWKLFLYFSFVTMSHPLLDMLTDGGLGVALFAPFSDKRFFLPWRPVEVSPIGVGFFSERGLTVILSEIIWIWIPSASIVLVSWVVRKRMRARRAESSSP